MAAVGMAADFVGAVAIGALTVSVHSIKIPSLGLPTKHTPVAVVIEFETSSETVCVRVRGGRLAVTVIGFSTDTDLTVLNVTLLAALGATYVLTTLQSMISRLLDSKRHPHLQ